MSNGIVLILELRYQANVLLNLLSLFLHELKVVGAFLVFDSFEHFMVFSNDSVKLFATIGFMKSVVKVGHTFFLLDSQVRVFISYLTLELPLVSMDWIFLKRMLLEREISLF